MSASIAVVVVLSTWQSASRLHSPRALVGWLGMGRAAHAVVVRPVLVLAAALARFDDHVLDRAVNGAGRATVAAALARATSAEDRACLLHLQGEILNREVSGW